MGTNYYLHYENERCPCCGHKKEPLHIGKSSFGWCFSLHVEPNDPNFPHNLEEWVSIWNLEDRFIKDEYGEEVSAHEMYSLVVDRKGAARSFDKMDWTASVFGGPPLYIDEADFHKINHSQRGPNGLLRHRVDMIHCVGHGDGTWDLVQGEFG